MYVAPVAPTAQRSHLRSEIQVPPLRGWNACNALSAMRAGDAIRLDNFICRSYGLELRPGAQRWLTGCNGAVQTLLVYGPKGGDQRMFAATPTAIYDVLHGRVTNILTNAVTMTPSVTGLTSGVWSWDQLTNAGVTALVCANGVDGVRVYDGRSWLVPSISCGAPNTTLDPLRLDGVIVHQRRLFFFERGTLRIWYLPLGHFGGNAQLVDLGGEVTQGGEIVALTTLSNDGGRGIDNRLVAITSNGEMVVFSGVAPERAATWKKVGAWFVPPPAGRRCFAQYGGDVLYLSKAGALPVTQVLAKPEHDKPRGALTEQIRRAYERAVIAGEGLAAWCAIESAKNRLMIINAPTPAGSMQMVLSSDGGWNAFVGLDAQCWAECGVDLFFGDASGNVFRLAGSRDDGGPVSGFIVEAYSRLKTPARKVFKRARAIFAQAAAMIVRHGIYTNFAPIPGTLTVPTETWGGTPWTWDQFGWALQPAQWTADVRGQVDVWRGITGHGHAAALMTTVSATEPVVYEGTEVAFEVGGGL